jgi:hypothetical protein
VQTGHPNIVGLTSDVLQTHGGARNVNVAASNAVQGFIQNGTVTIKPHSFWIKVIDYKLPSGLGVRFSAIIRKFITFLEQGL